MANTTISNAPDAGAFDPTWRIPIAVAGSQEAFSASAGVLQAGSSGGPFLPLAGGIVTGGVAFMAAVALAAGSTGPFLPTTGGTVTGPVTFQAPAALATGSTGPFLPIGGGNLSGNLTINKNVVYAGQRVNLAFSGLNISMAASGSTAGLDWIGLNNVNITSDTLNVNAPQNTLCSFQGEIAGTVLTIDSAITGPPAFSFTASIAGTTLTLSAPVSSGTITAGLTLSWTGGSDTILSGGGGGGTIYTLAHNNGIVGSQPMTLIGPAPLQTLSYGLDPENPNTAIIQGFSGTPNIWNLTTDQGVVPAQPMLMVKLAVNQQAIGLYWNYLYGGGSITGGRTGVRFQLTQAGAFPSHGNYQGGLISHSVRFSSGGSDLWNGAAGTVWGSADYVNMTGPVGVPGATNYRAALGKEIDYGCASGASGTDASVASIGGLSVNRWATHQMVPAIWEVDLAIGIGQQPVNVRDGSGNLLPVRAAKYGFRFGSVNGVNALDVAQGRAIAACFGNQAWNTDGTPGNYPNQSRHGVDWYSMDFTGTQFRGQGFSVVGSGGPFTAGAVQVGGGYLSATSSTISIDTAGSVVQSGTVAITGGQGGANLYPGLPLIHDDTGTIAIVTTVDNSMRPGMGAATAVFVRPNTGRAIQSQIPTNPVTFRASASPLGFPSPGPTGPNVTLTWIQPTKLALQPSGGVLELGAAGGTIGAFGATPVVKQTLTGSKGGNAAVASIVAAMVAYGFAIDSTT